MPNKTHPKMTLIISNLVSLNGGDAAIAFGMMRAISAAFDGDIDFVVGDSEPEAASRLYPELHFVKTLGLQAVSTRPIRFIGRYIMRCKRARYMLAAGLSGCTDTLAKLLIGAESHREMQLYRDSLAVISCGGTYLREDYGVASQLADYNLALKIGKPLFFYTQSIGSFKDPDTRAALHSVFDKAEAIFVRDEESCSNLRDIGADVGKVQIHSDAAFALADPNVLRSVKNRQLPADRPPKVAVSVRKWKHFANKDAAQGNEDYAKAMAEGITWLVREKGAQVTFLSTCQGVREYDDDSIFGKEIAQRLSADVRASVSVTDNRMDHTELMQRLAEHDMCLSTRMHMCILSLIAGTPVLPIAYEFKTKELFTRLGLGDMVLDMEEVDGSCIISGLHTFLASIDNRRSSLFAAVEKEYEDAMQTGAVFADILKGIK